MQWSAQWTSEAEGSGGFEEKKRSFDLGTLVGEVTSTFQATFHWGKIFVPEGTAFNTWLVCTLVPVDENSFPNHHVIIMAQCSDWGGGRRQTARMITIAVTVLSQRTVPSCPSERILRRSSLKSETPWLLLGHWYTQYNFLHFWTVWSSGAVWHFTCSSTQAGLPVNGRKGRLDTCINYVDKQINFVRGAFCPKIPTGGTILGFRTACIHALVRKGGLQNNGSVLQTLSVNCIRISLLERRWALWERTFSSGIKPFHGHARATHVWSLSIWRPPAKQKWRKLPVLWT